MARKYAFLDFQPGVDWKDVNAGLLGKLNRLGMKTGKTITITSGFRSRAEQERLYARYVSSGYDPRYVAAKPGQSNHEKGLAIDAVVDGKPVGAFFSRQTLAKYGLTTLYNSKGQPFDTVHIELLGGGKPTAAPTAAAPADQQQPDQSPAQTQLGTQAQPDVTIPAYTPPAGPPSPFETVAQPAAPGSAGAGINPEPDAVQAWSDIAAQPVADPMTGTFAQQVAVALGR